MGTNSCRKFIDITPKVTYTPPVEEATVLASKHNSSVPDFVTFDPLRNSIKLDNWWKKLDYVFAIDLEYINGDNGQLFNDFSRDEINATKNIKLVCFEDIDDARKLIALLTKCHRNEVEHVSVVAMKPREAEAIANEAGLGIFVI